MSQSVIDDDLVAVDSQLLAVAKAYKKLDAVFANYRSLGISLIRFYQGAESTDDIGIFTKSAHGCLLF